MIPVPSHHSRLHRWTIPLAALSIPILLFLITLPADAQVRRWLQPDSIPPMRKVYNVEPNEFIMGARLETSYGDSLSEIWRFARKLHINDWIWESGMNINGPVWEPEKTQQFHQLADMADSGERLCTANILLWTIGGIQFHEQGQMLEAYAFDSTQSPYVEWKFQDLQGKGSNQQNEFYNPLTLETDWPWRDYYTTERLYSAPIDTGLVLQHLAIRHHNDAVYTNWPAFTSLSNTANDGFLESVYSLYQNNPEFMKLWVAVKGHLIPPLDSTVAFTDTLFILHVTHVIPEGKKYLNDNDSIVTADAWTEILIDSFAVTKGDLYTDGIDLQKYRDVSDSTDLRYRFNNPALRGPFYRDSTGTILAPAYGSINDTASRIFDVKVFWTGKERAALRSVMVRNRTAELMYGSTQASVDFRQAVMDTARRVVYGVDSSGVLRSTDSIRKALFRIETGHEAGYFGFGTYRALKRFVADSLNSGGDTVAVGMVENNPGMMDQSHTMGDLDVVHIEYNYYGNYLTDTNVRGTLPFDRPPAIREHNGGRNDKLVGPPELGLTRDSIQVFTGMMQRFYHGYYSDTLKYWPKHNPWTVQEVAHAAQVSRDFGVPLYGIPGLVSYISYDTNGLEWVSVYDPVKGIYVDSLTAKNNRSRIGHLPEVSELRMADNLLLCYGGRGVNYFWLTSHFNVMAQPTSNIRFFPKGFNGPDTLMWGSRGDINLVGDSLLPYIEGRTTDVMDVVLYNTGVYHDSGQGGWTTRGLYDPGKKRDTIPQVYLGWKTRPDGLAAINQRIKELGSEMIRRGLRWRTSYSVHNQAIMPGTADTESTFTTRPLPSNELVTAVRAQHPISGVIDSAWNTYVELGLFYTVHDSLSDPKNDTNYIFVVNRRTFERPPELSDTTVRGRLMDSLTETRTLYVSVNMPNPDSTQYCFVRVREVLPDTTNDLALLGKRQPLDTIISNMDSAFVTTLRPGDGALFEVTHIQPDESMTGGSLYWNNQRKLVFFSDRWHSVYLRNDSVLYRRSLRATEEMGPILWEPVETVVSIDTLGPHTLNWPPSMTMRRYSGDTIVTVVWTTHSHSSAATMNGLRDVVVRDLNLTKGTSSKVEFVAFHSGQDSGKWGDAVVCAMHGGDIIAWGDSAAGVVAINRKLQPTGFPPVYSDTLHVDEKGRWPSVPTFAHIASKDSNCAIVWNKPAPVGYPNGDAEILYARLQQLDTGSTVPVLVGLNFMPVSPVIAWYGRPSIDQTQDRWARVQEGITWHKILPTYWHHAEVWFRTMYTPTTARPGWDSIEATAGWAFATTLHDAGVDYPTISSLNNFTTSTDTDPNVFSLAFANWNGDIYQGWVQIGYDSLRAGWPRFYAQSGAFPSLASSNRSQTNRDALLYIDDQYHTPPVLRTSRQFFGAKVRPHGYIAEGRYTALYVSDSARTGFTLLVNDPWIANDDESSPLTMVKRDPSTPIDSIPQWEGIMRTNYFHSHDSTTIGLELNGTFIGDSSFAGAATVRLYAEVVDSSTGTVIAVIDSLSVSAASDSQQVVIAKDLDLLSGTYYLRVKMDTANMSIDTRPNEARFLTGESHCWINADLQRRATRIEAIAREIRLSAQPNPFSGKTELRFSVVQPCLVDLRVYDLTGREVVTLMRREEYEEGRYAIELSAADLPAGSYIVELRAGEERITERVMVRK